jgi:hypothetical protein
MRVQVAAVGTPVKPSTSLRAKGSSGICGEGIADVCRPPRMGRSASVSEVSLDVSRATSHGSATSSSSQETQAQSSSPRTSSQGASSSQAQVRSPVARAQRTPPACEVIVVDSGTEESGDESVVVVRPGRRGQVSQGNRGGESRLSSPAITSRPSVDAVLPLGERRAGPAGAATLTVQSSTLQPSARLTTATGGANGAAISRPGDLRWVPPPPPPPRSPAIQASVPTALSARRQQVLWVQHRQVELLAELLRGLESRTHSLRRRSQISTPLLLPEMPLPATRRSAPVLASTAVAVHVPYRNFHSASGTIAWGFGYNVTSRESVATQRCAQVPYCLTLLHSVRLVICTLSVDTFVEPARPGATVLRSPHLFPHQHSGHTMAQSGTTLVLARRTSTSMPLRCALPVQHHHPLRHHPLRSQQRWNVSSLH